MATLRFSFGTMGSGKSTLALQIHHNLSSRGLRGLLLTKLDRDGAQVTSRLGVSSPAYDISSTPSLVALARQHMPLDFLVCDEVQFYSIEQCDELATIVDDFGMRKLPQSAAEDLLEIIMRRYENRSTMMTSNRPVEEWGKLLSDVPAASAILDRLLHNAEVIPITGRSYRLQQGAERQSSQSQKENKTKNGLI